MTYDEAVTAAADTTFKSRVKVALIVAAEKIRLEDPRTTPKSLQRLEWAKLAFTEPDSILQALVWAVVAQNRTATLAQVTGASDATIQTAVDAAVSAFTI